MGARAGRAVARSPGRPACGSPSGSLGSPGGAVRRDDGELLEFPAAGERERPGEPAQRGSGRGRRSGRPPHASPLPSPRPPLRGCGRFPRPGPGPPPGEAGGSPPPPLLRGWRGSRPALPRPGRPTGARCRRRPSPRRLVSLSAPSPPPESEALRPPGEGAGAQARPPGGQVARGAAAAKTRERLPSAGRPAPPARAEASKDFLPAGGRRGRSLPGPLPWQRPSRWTADGWGHPGWFPQLRQRLALGVTLHLAGQGVQKRDPGGRASRLPEPRKPGELVSDLAGLFILFYFISLLGVCVCVQRLVSPQLCLILVPFGKVRMETDEPFGHSQPKARFSYNSRPHRVHRAALNRSIGGRHGLILSLPCTVQCPWASLFTPLPLTFLKN